MIAIDPNSQSQERVLKVLDLWRDRINIIAYTNDSQWVPLGLMMWGGLVTSFVEKMDASLVAGCEIIRDLSIDRNRTCGAKMALLYIVCSDDSSRI
jgi:hypothetical protein